LHIADTLRTPLTAPLVRVSVAQGESITAFKPFASLTGTSAYRGPPLT